MTETHQTLVTLSQPVKGRSLRIVDIATSERTRPDFTWRGAARRAYFARTQGIEERETRSRPQTPDVVLLEAIQAP